MNIIAGIKEKINYKFSGGFSQKQKFLIVFVLVLVSVGIFTGMNFEAIKLFADEATLDPETPDVTFDGLTDGNCATADAYSCLDDGDRYTDGTPANTSTDFITLGNNDVARFHLGTQSPVSTVSSTTVYVWHQDDTNGIVKVALYDETDTIIGTAIDLPTNTGGGWDSATWSGLSLSQTTLNGLRLHLEGEKSGANPSENIYVAYVVIEYTAPDTTAPTPDPPYFATAPYALSTASIGATSTTLTDASTPVNYYFQLDNTACGADAGSGGTDSGYQTSNEYTDSGLSPNQCYGYKLGSRDSNSPTPNYSGTSTASTTYTLAATPGAPSFAVGTTSLTLTHDDTTNPTSNPTTLFAIQCTSCAADATWDDKYISSDGLPSDSAVWLSDSVWNTTNNKVWNLDSGKTYSFQSMARNGDNIVTASSTAGTGTPDDDNPTPDPATFSVAPNYTDENNINMTATALTDANSVEYYFGIYQGDCGADYDAVNGTNSGWQGSNAYTDSGLLTNKCYAYQVQGRDTIGNEGASSSASSVYTQADTPGTPTLDNITTDSMRINLGADNNPSSAPNTEYLVLASSTDGTWDNQYVTSTGNPSGPEVWVLKTAFPITINNNMDEVTYYGFEIRARNGDDIATNWTTEVYDLTNDGTAPTPDPPYFTTAPDDVDTVSIDMTSVVATDLTGPVQYSFANDNSDCTPAHIGTGGSSSGWQGGNTFTDDTLQVNHCYGYTIQTRDSFGTPNVSTLSTASTTYTQSAVPGTPTLGNPTGSSLDITVFDANGNPIDDGTHDTLFAIQASSTDLGWNDYWITAAGGTTTSEVWLTNAQITGGGGLTLSPMEENTWYGIQIKSQNGDAEENPTLSSEGYARTSDVTAPTPNPATFNVAPDDLSNSSIDMTADTLSDPNPPVEYYFGVYLGDCGGDFGNGGSNSGWQGGTTFTDDTLDVNHCYAYQIQGRDSEGNYTSSSSASSAYTAANAPGTPTVNNPSGTTLDVTVAHNGNPTSGPATEYVVFASSTDTDIDGYWIDATGATTTTETWLTDTDLDPLVVNNLQENTYYGFEMKARNGDGDDTASSSEGYAKTNDVSAPTPNPPTFSIPPDDLSNSSIDMTATPLTDPNTPVEYYFGIYEGDCGVDFGTGGTNSGWQSADNTYTDSGLDVNQCYTYQIQGRDSVGNYTSSSTAVSAYTTANDPVAPTINGETYTTLTVNLNADGNPATTSYSIYVVSSTPNDPTWVGSYVDASGNPSGSPVWIQGSTFPRTAYGLENTTNYVFRLRARNGDGDETSDSPTANGTTTTPPPAITRFKSGVRLLDGVRIVK